MKTKKFPYLVVRGSHRDVGYAIGENFRDKIRESVLVRREGIENYKDLRRESQNHFLETLRFFPKYIEELTATAIAANVGIMDLFFANTRSLYDGGVASESGELVIHDKCTTVVSFNNGEAIVGHNEDWATENIDDLYILKATVGGTKFIGINYVNELPGTSASMNSWGLVQGINEVHQKETVGIPKNFLARAVLECKTLDEADTMIRRVKQDTGFNHLLVQGDRVKDVEIAGGKVKATNLKNEPYVHTNHFLSDLKKYETFHTKSSAHRFKKASELLTNGMNEQDIVGILSDKSDKDFPICRHDATLASLIFKPAKGEVNICYGPPCQGEFEKYTI